MKKIFKYLLESAAKAFLINPKRDKFSKGIFCFSETPRPPMEPPPLMPIFNGYGSSTENSSPSTCSSEGSSPPWNPSWPPFSNSMAEQTLQLPMPKKRGRGRTRGSGPSLLPCSVCGDMAPAHMHYGGVACFSCRAFFRRSVDKASLYECQEQVKIPK